MAILVSSRKPASFFELQSSWLPTSDPFHSFSQSLSARKTSTALLETFNPRTTTLDAYFQDAEFLQNPLLGEVELNFVHQVFYGCHRYSKLLKLFVTSFIYKEPTTALRSEQPLYNILAYLLFFRQAWMDDVSLESVTVLPCFVLHACLPVCISFRFRQMF